MAGYHPAAVAPDLMEVQTIDAHVGGAPVRLIVGGFPPLRGETLRKKQQWATRRADAIRRGLLLEPRGHRDLTAAVLTDSHAEGALAGLLMLGQGGIGGFRGQEVIASVTIALERGLIVPPIDGSFRIETVAGLVDVHPRIDRQEVAGSTPPRVREVAYRPPPVFVHQASLPVAVDGRSVHVDVAWSWGWYAIVDREALGIPPESGALDVMRRGALAMMRALDPRVRAWTSPGDTERRIEAVILTGPPTRGDADLRSITVYHDGTIDRSPSGTGTAAVLAVLDAMGLTAGDRSILHEGPSGAVFRASVVERRSLDEAVAIVAEVSSDAWITGEHTFVFDARDPFVTGFAL